MRLDLSALRYLTPDDFRVLTAIEMGMRNHEVVPVELIESIAKLKKASTSKTIANLLKHKLIKHTNIQYDGYSLNFLGFDYLAIHVLIKRGVIMKVGPKLGVGKESDVFVCWVNMANIEKEMEITEDEFNKLKSQIVEEEEENNPPEETQNELKEEDEKQKDHEPIGEKNEDKHVVFRMDDNEHNIFDQEIDILNTKCQIAVIKLARLGRTSFRAVKNKRDYVKNKSHYNWLYLSRVSAANEYKFLQGLYANKFPVPKPYGHNRHAIVMEYIPSFPLCRVEEMGDKEKAYNDLVSVIIDLARKGLVHGDFNEFNILVETKTQKMYIIDFPQVISICHQDAEMYFNRDIDCVNTFFKKKYGMIFEDSKIQFNEITREAYLDIELKAYGNENALGNCEEKDVEEIPHSEDEFSDIEEDNQISGKEKKAMMKKKEDELNLNFDDEMNKNTTSITSKVRLNKDDIKEKVKRALEKENKKQTPKSNNRFKGKKNIGIKKAIKEMI